MTDDAPEDETSEQDPAGGFNIISLWDEESRHRVGIRDFPRVVGRAVRLVYRAAPGATILTVLLGAVTASLSLGQILVGRAALEALLNAATRGTGIRPAVLPMLGLALLAGVASISAVIQGLQQRLIGDYVQRRVLGDIFAICTRVPLERYEDPRFFDQLQRVQTNALQRPTVIATGLSNVVTGLLGSVAITLALLKIAPLLVPVLLLAGVPGLVLGRWGSQAEFRFAVGQATGFRRRYYIQEVLTGRPGAKEVRAFGTAAALRARWEAEFDRYLQALRGQVQFRTLLGVASGLLAALLGAVALLLVVYLVARHRLVLASAGAAVIAVRLLNGQITALAAGLSGLYESALFLFDYERFTGMHVPSVADSEPAADAAVDFAAGFSTLRTRRLRFRYPAGRVDALRGVDIEIRAGEVVALVGENGSGKTTLAKLLAGLYTPTAGAVLWDDVDLATVPQAAVREGVAVIFQDFQTYALSAADNIGLGRPERLDDRPGIVAAARQSGADSFLAQLDEGYDTYLSSMFPGGRDLSVGQWQRVAIARAFFRSAPFVILDEPSSALDPRAEQDLFSRIRTLLAGRTVLFVSHRFSTVRSADRIYVMSDGKVAEHGTHEELMARKGLYAELFTLQAAGYEGHRTATTSAAESGSPVPPRTSQRQLGPRRRSPRNAP